MKTRDAVFGLMSLAMIGCVPAPRLADVMPYRGAAKLHRLYVLVDNRLMVGVYAKNQRLNSRWAPVEKTHGWAMESIFSGLLASQVTRRLTDQGLVARAGVVEVAEGPWVYANVAPLSTADVAVQAQFREAASFAPDALLILTLTKLPDYNNSTIYEVEYDVSLQAPGDHALLWRTHTNKIWTNTGHTRDREQAAARFSAAVVDALKRVGAI